MKGAVAVNREWIAYHEAGHAVAAHYYGEALSSIQIHVPKPEAPGIASHGSNKALHPPFFADGDTWLTLPAKEKIEWSVQHAVVLAAGAVAEKRFRRLSGNAVPRGTLPGMGGFDVPGSDSGQIKAVADLVYGADAPAFLDDLMEKGIDGAEKLFRTRATWNATASLASALERRGTLHGTEIRLALCRYMPFGSGLSTHVPSAKLRVISEADLRFARTNSKLAWQWITPEDAVLALQSLDAGLDRYRKAPDPRRVERFASAMRSGNFVLTAEPIAFDLQGNLVEGRHRLLACVESGVTFPALVGRGWPAALFRGPK